MPNLFDLPLDRLKEIAVGEKPSKIRDKLNAPIEAVNRILGGVTPPQQVKPDPLLLGIEAKWFQVGAVEGDYIIDLEGSTKIAKPRLLRKTPFDGKTDLLGVRYTYRSNEIRTSVRGSTTEEQIVNPAYNVLDYILAVRGVKGGTGAFDVNGRAIDWQDWNNDARAWAKITSSGSVIFDGGVAMLDGNIIAIEYVV